MLPIIADKAKRSLDARSVKVSAKLKLERLFSKVTDSTCICFHLLCSWARSSNVFHFCIQKCQFSGLVAKPNKPNLWSLAVQEQGRLISTGSARVNCVHQAQSFNEHTRMLIKELKPNNCLMEDSATRKSIMLSSAALTRL